MRDSGRRLVVLMTALLASHCRAEPATSAAPTPTAARPAAPSVLVARPLERELPPAPALPVAPSAASAATAPAPSSAASTASAPSAAATAVNEDPPLLGPDGVALPQTEERPSTTSERFQRRMQLLADSILSGDAEPARAAFFPLVAYTQVKDVQKPERDYRYRLVAHFERDIREYHQKLGKDVERAKFLGVSVPEPRVEWMKPGREGNRLGYFRVLRSSLRFELPNGKQQSLELTSMISWRGEWYVVHLHGFE